VLRHPPQRPLDVHRDRTGAPAGRRSTHEVLQGSARACDEGGGTTSSAWRSNVWRILSSRASEEGALLVQRRAKPGASFGTLARFHLSKDVSARLNTAPHEHVIHACSSSTPPSSSPQRWCSR